MLHVQSKSVLQSLYIKLKGVTQKSGGGRGGGGGGGGGGLQPPKPFPCPQACVTSNVGIVQKLANPDCQGSSKQPTWHTSLKSRMYTHVFVCTATIMEGI